MKNILKYLKKLYNNQKLEYQYLLLVKENRVVDCINISSHNTPNSSITNFETINSIVPVLEKDKYDICIVHNHPGSNSKPCPSNMDFRNAELITMFLNYLGYQMSDYLIFSKKGYFSFKEANYLSNSQEILNIRNKLLLFNDDSSLDISSSYNISREFLKDFDVLCISNRKNNNYFVFPLELSFFREQNTIVESITFIKESFANAKTINFVKALYKSDYIFIVNETSELNLIV